jgi:hypothetical protein
VPEPVVEFKNVRFAYDRAEVLHDISFIFGKDEIVGLLGPNGAGARHGGIVPPSPRPDLCRDHAAVHGIQ